MDRLVAVQLSLQPHPSAGSEHSLRLDPPRAADRPPIVGRLYADDRVLRAARAFETTQPERRPPLVS